MPIYRPESFTKIRFVDAISNLLDFYNESYDNVLVIGDMNMEVTDSEMSPLTKGHNLYSMIKSPTCFKSKIGRCIDLMLSNKKKYNFMHTQSFANEESDFHHMIYTMFKTTFVKLPPKKIKYRCYKKFNLNLFQQDLAGNLLNSNTIIHDYNIFEKTFQHTLDKHAPYKTKYIKGNNKPFLTKDLRKAIATRSRLFNICNITKEPSDILKYKKQRNFVKKLNFVTKRNYYKNLDPKKLVFNKKFWKTFKPLFSNKSMSAEKLILVENDDIISDDFEIAGIMNTHFANITKPLKITKWPEPDSISDSEDSVSKYIRKFSNHPSITKIKSNMHTNRQFKFRHIEPDVVRTKIRSLNTSKSVGGYIPVNILKENIDVYDTFLTDFFNSCVNDGIFPGEMKLADVTPVFKDGDKTFKANYRPISLLSALSKVLERIMCDQINDFMIDKLSKFLCGFRKKHCTEDALIFLLENWRQKLESKNLIGTILCDLSKAFDTLPHDLIIAKLSAYGFSFDALKMISSYLSDRMQRCKIGSSYSDWVDILIGVPQGSVLGPLLFNIFMNDFFSFITQSNVCNFADDSSLYAYGMTLSEVVEKLENDTKRAMDWFHINSLVPNPNKFQMMFLGTKSKINLCLEINGNKCISSDKVKLLGITIDWKLHFNNHVKLLCEKANQKASALMRLRNKLSIDKKLVLFNSFVSSQFGYCPLVWMFCGKTTNDLVRNVHKRALRALYNDFDSNYGDLLAKGNHKTIHELNVKKLIVKVYKCINGDCPEILKYIFVKNENINYNLRIKNLLILPKKSHTITYGLHSFKYRGSATWNSLSDSIKECKPVSVLNKKLKESKIVCSCKICVIK